MTTLKDLIEGDDLDIFLDASEFATLAVFTGVSGGPYSVKGIIDKGEPVFNDTTGHVDAEITTFQVKTSDFAQVRNHDSVIIGNVTYKVETFDHDGTGLTTLTLYKASEG